jgi:Fe-S cluster biogenesis protein NfuA
MAVATETEIKITAEPTNNPASFRFVVDRPVLPGAGARFASKSETVGSPLAEAIFNIPTVSGLQVAENIVTVTKDGADEWLPVARQVGAAIRSTMKSATGPLIAPDAADRAGKADAEIKARIAKVFEESINPAVAMHGGFVELVDYKANVVYVRMGGGCQGCASSVATLKGGVERMIREVAPEIVEVVDVTDHAAGANPYFH